MMKSFRSFRPSQGSVTSATRTSATRTSVTRQRRRICLAEQLEAREMLDGASLLVTEFMASNSTVLRNRFREFSDWIEIHNPTDEAVSVNGWRLTDDADDLEKWQLPEVSIPADGYLVVFASGEDQVDPESELHTNFKLSSEGEYLGLVRPDGTISHEYKPAYPAQSTDVSYGLRFNDEGAQVGVVGFFPNATPGEANGADGLSAPAPDVEFSVQRGFFEEPFELTLSTDNLGASIRYTTDGTAPTAEHGDLYDQAITIDTTTTLRGCVWRGLTDQRRGHAKLYLLGPCADTRW